MMLSSKNRLALNQRAEDTRVQSDTTLSDEALKIIEIATGIRIVETNPLANNPTAE